MLASHEMLEVICVDDGSTDKTKSIIDSYDRTYTCVRSIVHKENLGTLEARRSGSLAATGDYILYLDQDDLGAPRNLCKHPNISAGFEDGQKVTCK